MQERYTSDLPIEVRLRQPEPQDVDEFWQPFGYTDNALQHDTRQPERRDAEKSRDYFDTSDAQSYIDEIVYRTEIDSVDIIGTAQNVDIPVEYTYSESATFMGAIGGLGDAESERKIQLRADMNQTEKIFTFSHEIGHLFLKEIWPDEGHFTSDEEETFSDYFARAMVMPKSYAEQYGLFKIDEEKILRLSRGFKISVENALYQLIEYGALEDKVAVDTYMHTSLNMDNSEKVHRVNACLHCQETGGDIDCPNAGKDGRLFDFTDYAWNYDFSTCAGEELVPVSEMDKLTAYYESLPRQIPLMHYWEDSVWGRNKSTDFGDSPF